MAGTTCHRDPSERRPPGTMSQCGLQQSVPSLRIPNTIYPQIDLFSGQQPYRYPVYSTVTLTTAQHCAFYVLLQRLNTHTYTYSYNVICSLHINDKWIICHSANIYKNILETNLDISTINWWRIHNGIIILISIIKVDISVKQNSSRCRITNKDEHWQPACIYKLQARSRIRLIRFCNAELETQRTDTI